VKTGKTKRNRSLFRRLRGGASRKKKRDIEHVIEHDKQQSLELLSQSELDSGETSAEEPLRQSKKPKDIYSRNAIEKFAYDHISPLLPKAQRYKDAFEQAGLSIIFESYASTAILLSIIAVVPAVAAVVLVEAIALHATLFSLIIESALFGVVTFFVSILLWFVYPLERRRSFKAKLESQLAYSFGILGVLSAAGINIERMFERLAASDSNPILANLARRFIRNIKIFGLDTESALREVAKHTPSASFAKMLDSIAVAFKTTGSVHELIMFESTRLLTEKNDKLKKKVGDLAIMAELYITLVVVGPIIFIVMLSILQLLPYSGSLPSIPIINALVFVGIPAISIGFVLMLDSMVSRI
ncbi:MAG: type II secretion system F family protein, partial [Nitrososphaerales archaeon]